MAYIVRVLLIFFLLLLAACAADNVVRAPSKPDELNLRTASYDGIWSGVIKARRSYSQRPQDGDFEWTLRFDIQGASFQVYRVISDENGVLTGKAILPGTFAFSRLSTNAVATSMRTGQDRDGTWIETWSYAMTLVDPDRMLVHWTRIVNNVDLPKESGYSKFSAVGMGELIRSDPAR